MNTAFVFGRFCLRRGGSTIARAFSRRQQCFSRKHSLKEAWRRRVSAGPGTPRTILVIAALSPAAFLQISEEEVTDGQTAEVHMLEASREEIKKKIPDDVHGINRLFRGIVFVL